MATLTHRIEVQLAGDELLPLADIRGRRVRCLEGRVWMTLDRDPRDIFLGPGDSFVVDRSGATLLQALETARLRVDACGDVDCLAVPQWLRALAAAARRLFPAAAPASSAGA